MLVAKLVECGESTASELPIGLFADAPTLSKKGFFCEEIPHDVFLFLSWFPIGNLRIGEITFASKGNGFDVRENAEGIRFFVHPLQLCVSDYDGVGVHRFFPFVYSPDKAGA
jgi:hypothetical protein